MTLIEIDASAWHDEGEFYETFLKAIGAPDWHGKNLDALWDSISSDDINVVKAPYEIRIANARESACIDLLMKVQSIFDQAQEEGLEVRMVLE